MAIDKRRAIVRAETLIATEPFQSVDDKRFYLNGTCIEPQANGAIAVATDGHTMIAINQADGYASGPATVWNCMAKARFGALLKSVRRMHDYDRDANDLWIDLQSGNPGGTTMTAIRARDAQEILNGGGERKLQVIDAVLVDGSFPDYRRVFPVIDNDAPGWTGPSNIQARYLKRASDVATALVTYQPTINFGNVAAGGPITATIPGRPDVICLFMPVRTGENSAPLIPDWLSLSKAAPADATEEKPDETPVKKPVKKAA